MARRELQTLNLKFDQVMFKTLVFTWESTSEAMSGNFLGPVHMNPGQ